MSCDVDYVDYREHLGEIRLHTIFSRSLRRSDRIQQSFGDLMPLVHPSTQGGDEARVARARGSGRGALPSTILANGTPSSSVPPPRAGWAVRITEATRTPTSSLQCVSSAGTARGVVERWASERAPSALSDRCTSPSSSEARTAAESRVFPPNRVGRVIPVGTGIGVAADFDFENLRQEEDGLEAKKKEEQQKRQQQQPSPRQPPPPRRTDAAVVARCQTEHLELRGQPMSQNNAIPPHLRPPSSHAGSVFDPATDLTVATEETEVQSHAARLQQQQQQIRIHDHNRPFPPPRLPGVHGTSPLSTRSARPQSPVADTRTAASRLPLVTAPLTPLSSTFRSRPSLRQPQSIGQAETSSEANTRGALLTSTEASSQPPRSPVGAVSLTVPRPDGERTINEYVEAPFKQCTNQERRAEAESKRPGDCPKIDRRHRQKGAQGHGDANAVAPTHRGQRHSRSQGFRGLAASATAAPVATTGGGGTSAVAVAANTTSMNVVTKQPVSFTKEPANTLASRAFDPAGLSIMCDFCGRCRCESCREPPPLPSRWLCDNSCYCAADTILDYASCLCCVKGLFYHCADGSSAGGIDAEAAGTCADEPCSCTGNKRTSRWACLGALTLVMPCLLCYWPLKGCVAICEACYARHAAQGCRCNPNALGSGRHHPIANDIGDSRDPEKRLLDPVTPEL